MSTLEPAWRPPTSEIPNQPGVYRFRDGEGRVIYVGKAKNLRSRLVNYFQDPALLHPRTAQMVSSARSVQWTIVGTEIEALTLEFQWINEFDPRFNVIFRDDKSYPYLSVSMGEKYPRLAISRNPRRPGTRYFGPYAQVWAIRETIDLLIGTFPIRTCSAGVFRSAEAQGRPCLLGYIDRCSAPCVGRISAQAHREMAEELCSFMEGKTKPYIAALGAEMAQAAAEMDYELAAKKRDQLAALEKVQERNAIVLDGDDNADVYALVGDELDVAVHAFYVRGGRVRGTKGWVVDRLDGKSDEELMGEFLEQNYLERTKKLSPNEKIPKASPVSVDDVAHLPLEAIPAQILVSVLPGNREFLEEWLGEFRGAGVRVRQPQRGRKAELMETVSKNSRHALELYKTRRSGDLTQRSAALEELQIALGMENAPLRIECFDVSHLAGSHRVASMVVFEDGAPRKDAYRTFNVRDAQEGPNDDTAAMSQILERRFARSRTEDLQIEGEASEEDTELTRSGPIDPETGRPRRFAYQPDLLVVDGGLPQVNAAAATLESLGVDIPVVGLAKRLEEVWVPGNQFPVILPRTSPSLYLLQYLRDESHRFAIKKHRAKRTKAQTRSALDAVPGLGPTRQKDLLRAFGSVKRIREASLEELMGVPGIGLKMAEAIQQQLSETKASEPVE